MSAGILIVGGGIASQRCAETLRARGYDGPVRIVCGEPEAPYDRPPLSKDVLAGEVPDRETRLRPDEWYAANGVELLIGTRAVRLDPAARTVELAGGDALGYEKLLVATGSQARRLRAFDGFTNVHHLRTLADARRLREELRGCSRLAVVGAGFIGQEVAATARGAGVDVTMVEALDLPLAPVLGETVGRWIAELHRGEGVELLLSARLEAARGGGRVEELVLAGGRRIGCDAVVVGVGAAPAAGWVAAAGLDPAGVPTDAAGRTALPGVFAAGDVARAWDPRGGGHRRTEHWDAASRQGAAVARAMLGEEAGPPAVPSFWSDQYGARIQYVGDASAADAVAVEGDPADRDFSVLFTSGGRPVAAFAVGRPRELVRLRRRIEQAEPASEPALTH